MNITTFKGLTEPTLKSKHEKCRLRFLDNRTFKYLSLVHLKIQTKDLTEEKCPHLWCKINEQFAQWEKSARKIRHEQKSKKAVIRDYSNTAYEGCADDL